MNFKEVVVAVESAYSQEELRAFAAGLFNYQRKHDTKDFTEKTGLTVKFIETIYGASDEGVHDVYVIVKLDDVYVKFAGSDCSYNGSEMGHHMYEVVPVQKVVNFWQSPNSGCSVQSALETI